MRHAARETFGEDGGRDDGPEYRRGSLPALSFPLLDTTPRPRREEALLQLTSAPSSTPTDPSPSPTSQAPDGLPPWKRSWLYRAPGETPTLAWILGIHLLALVGVLMLPFPGLSVVGVAFALLFLGGLGTTIGYHRALAHRAIRLHPIVEGALIGSAVFNGSGNPLTWVATHRFHHAHSDTERDVSSPHQGGFWWAHLRWLWQAEQGKPEKHCPDLIARGYRVWSRLQWPILALALLSGLLLWPSIGWRGALAACVWLGPLRLVLALHAQCSVNSVCHLGRITREHGSGRDVWWLTFLHMGQGENWHANHHASARDPRLGRRWWQVDLGWWLILLLERCGLATVARISG
jgi:fatty-acid desaturase